MREPRPSPTLRSRILIVENHEIVAQGLKQLLEPEFGIAGIVKNGVDFVRPAIALKPDLILCNISMSSLDGLKAAKRVKKILPQIKIVYLTVDTDPNLAMESFDYGCASGYLLKTCSASELTIAIRTALKGQSYISFTLRDAVSSLRWKEKRQPADESKRLTQRQREILRLLVGGYSLSMASSELGLTERNVRFHRYRIMERLGAKSVADLVKFAVRNRLLAKSELAQGRKRA